MMTILYTRHGQTDWNLKHLIQGNVDIPLNEEGIRQAKKLHDRLLDTPIDLIYSSPLQRAHDTALYIRGERDIPVLTSDLLKEQHYGRMEGQSRKDNPEYLKQRTSFFKRYPDGESYLDVYHRVATFFERLKAEYDGKAKIVLIVAHGGMSRVVNCYFEDMENDEFPNYSIQNCQIKKYVLK